MNPTWGPVVFASNVDASNGPINPSTSFAYGILRLYGTWSWSNANPGTPYSYEWYWDGTYLAGSSGTLPAGTGRIAPYLYMQGGSPLPCATYRLVIKVNNVTVAQSQCTIEGCSPNLEMFTPEFWYGCVYCDSRDDNFSGQPSYLSILYDTYVFWAAQNTGSATVTKTPKFGVYVDGALVAMQSCTDCVPWYPGETKKVKVRLIDTIKTAGIHTVEVMADPDNEIPESDESDNLCAFQGSWSPY